MKEGANVLVIINPVSGQGDQAKLREKVEAKLEAEGVAYEVRETQAEGDALKWAKETQADLVIVSGGDGTVMETMSGLIENEREVPLAQLPGGTANLLARSLGVPIQLDAALELALNGVSVPLDVGYLPERERYFAIVAGAGWDARMIEDAPREIKNRLGFLAYIVSGVRHLFTLKRSDVVLEVDGQEHRFRAHTVMLINVGEIADTNLKMGDSNPFDGKLDLAIVVPNTLGGILRLVFRLVTGNFENYRDLKTFSAERVKVSATPPLEVQIDGETLGHTPFSAEVVPGGALLVVPADYAAEKGFGDAARESGSVQEIKEEKEHSAVQ